MKLKEQIANVQQEGAKHAPPEMLQKVMDEIQRLAATVIADTALKAGDVVPDFILPDADGNLVRIYDLLKEGNIVLSFSRGTWCPFCSLEYKAQQAQWTEIKEAGATLIGISPQIPSNAKEALEKNGIDFPILFDKGNEVGKMFGLVWVLSEGYRPVNLAFGSDLPSSNGDSNYELPMPATYVINKEGKIIYAYINPSWLERPNPEEYSTILN